VAFSNDGKTLAFAGTDKTISLYDLTTGKLGPVLAGHSDVVWSVAFSPDDKMLASGSSDRTVRLWDVARHKNIASWVADEKQVRCLQFSRDGKILASAGADNSVKLWDVPSGRKAASYEGTGRVALSPDGKIFASATSQGTIMLWDLATGKSMAELQGHVFPVTGLAFSSDRRTLVSGGADGKIKFWDVDSGAVRTAIQTEEGPVMSLALNPKDTTVASRGPGKSISIWDPARDQRVTTLRGHIQGVTCVAFSTDGKTLASGSHDSTVIIYDLPSEKARLTIGVPIAGSPTPVSFRYWSYFAGSPFGLLRIDPVRKELNASKTQIEQIEKVVQDIGEKYQKDFDTVEKLEESERNEKEFELRNNVKEDSTRALASVLGPDQRTRLMQLHRQMQGMNAFLDMEVQSALALTVEQIDGVRGIFFAAIQARSEDGPTDNALERGKKMRARNKEGVQKILVLLTDEQQKQWKDLIGKPFDFEKQGK
jgi:WD40 repeat protein